MPASDCVLGWSLKLGTVLLASAVLLMLVQVFSSFRYDWDLDHEIYFGQRLLAGELIWTREFHDKLPFLQIMFALPAWFESVQAWRMVSLLMGALAALCMVVLVPRIFDLTAVQPVQTWLLSYVALAYLALTLLLPGDLAGINPPATSFCLIATLVILHTMHPPEQGGPRMIRAIMLGSLLGAIAISMRPYFVLPLMLCVFWSVFIRLPGLPRPSLSKGTLLLASWTLAFGIWGFVLNLLPYIALGQTEALREGLAMMAKDINPSDPLGDFLDNLSYRITTLIWGSLALMALVFATRFTRGAASNGPLILMFGSIFVLGLFISRTHWWPHYNHFFTGYFCLVLALFITWAAAGTQQGRFKILAPVMCLSLVVSALFLPLFAWRLGAYYLPGPQEDIRASELQAFTSYLADNDAIGRSFLAPTNMYLHWALNEPRHGFPHAANTGHIYSGWWQDVDQFNSFATPRDPAQYCTLLKTSAPELIVTTVEDARVACLRTDGSPYQLDAKTPIANAGTLFVFKRR